MGEVRGDKILSQYVPATQKEHFGNASSLRPIFQALTRALRSTEVVKNLPNIEVEWSAGLGNWAKVPWVSFLDRRETDTTRKGVYCVFLFREDMSGVYLTLNQGVQGLNEEKGRAEARKTNHERALTIRQTSSDLSEIGFHLDDGIDLRPSTELGKDYQYSTIAYKLYEKEHVPDDDQIRSDLGSLLSVYDKYVSSTRAAAKIAKRYWIFQASPQYYDIEGALRNLKQQTWTVSQFKDKIHAGDRVFVWESGQNAGILSTATIMTEPNEINFPEQEKPFTRDRDKFEGLHTAVTIRVDRILAERLSRRRLLEDALLKDLSIIRNPRGTNFEVTPEETKRILELLGEDHASDIEIRGETMSIPRNCILYGPPGTGKTYWSMRKAVEICDGSLPQSGASIRDRYRKLCEEKRIEFVTFHQSYGYEDFVEGIRPVLARNREDERHTPGPVKYECRDGVFKRICSVAASNGVSSEEGKSQRNYVLIIDEINRGNIAKIFGELISLIEIDKRIRAVNEIKATLPYSGEQFGVPENLFILGTMNTADRSIALLDAALRRRFRFEEMMPDMEVVRRNVGNHGVIDSVDVAALVNQINARIEHLFDRDHQIGHAYFLGVKSLRDLLEVFRFQVTPLLQEYFYNDWAKICVVLGCPHDPTTGKSLTKNPFPLIKVEACDAVDAAIVDGVEPRFRYKLNSALQQGADLVECFRWVQGIPAESGPQTKPSGNS